MLPIIIWINEQPLIICQYQKEIPAYILSSFSPLQLLSETNNISEKIKEMMNNKSSAVIIETENINDAFAAVAGQFSVWQAAGGLVTDAEGKILLLFRCGKWDLPKGKLDAGETLEACAIREITEETGLFNLKLENKICETYHVYTLKNELQPILKHTHWYKIKSTGRELTVPQIEEDITDIQWVSANNISKYLRHSYPNIITVFREADVIEL